MRWCLGGALTEDVQLVGVGDGAVSVLHHTGVVPPVRRNRALHDQAPLLLPQLRREGVLGPHVSLPTTEREREREREDRMSLYQLQREREREDRMSLYQLQREREC